jgi:hypothetical protein
MTKSIKKMKNKILAMDAAPAAIPVNPKSAATIATMKNITDQDNIESPLPTTPEFRFRLE